MIGALPGRRRYLPARRKVANPLALVVLAWLLLGPAHPYELSRRLLESEADQHVKYTRSSLYMVIGQLRKAGFIAERETVRDRRWPERTIYEITGEGRTEYRAWMRTLIARPDNEYPKFGVALSLLGGLPPVEAVELLTARRVALAQQIEELRANRQAAMSRGLDWIFLIEDDFKIERLDAEERFITRLVPKLADPDYATNWMEWQKRHIGQEG
ncbi:PadR family transcriptional regulator [Nocardia brasiliensis]